MQKDRCIHDHCKHWSCIKIEHEFYVENQKMYTARRRVNKILSAMKIKFVWILKCKNEVMHSCMLNIFSDKNYIALLHPILSRTETILIVTVDFHTYISMLKILFSILCTVYSFNNWILVCFGGICWTLLCWLDVSYLYIYIHMI